MYSSATSVRHHACDVASRLREQIETFAGSQCTVKTTRERPWASITFSGVRHRITIDCASCGQDQRTQLESRLKNHEFNLPGHFVADLLISENTACVNQPMITLEILTIIDPVTPGLE